MAASTRTSTNAATASRPAGEAQLSVEERTKLTAVVDSIWEHREELARMAQDLPALLQEAGTHMNEAGRGARRASAALGDDVRELTAHAADMLEASKHQLKAVLHALEGAGKVLRNLPLIGDMGKMMGESLGAIGDVADNLDAVGGKVRGLGDRLASVGEDLDLMGKSLLGGGARLTSYGTTPAPAKRAAKKAAQQPATKAAGKAPAKAVPAKKAAKKPVQQPVKKAAAKKAGAARSGRGAH
jgi:hypothetical protein